MTSHSRSGQLKRKERKLCHPRARGSSSPWLSPCEALPGLARSTPKSSAAGSVLEEILCIIKLANWWLIMKPGVARPQTNRTLGRQLRARRHSLEFHESPRRRHPGVLRAVERQRRRVRDASDRPRCRVRCDIRDPDGYMIEVARRPDYSRADSRRSARGSARSRTREHELTGWDSSRPGARSCLHASVVKARRRYLRAGA